MIEGLRSSPFHSVLEEPVERWKDFAGVNLLSRLYSSKERGSQLTKSIAGGEFQSAVLATMAGRHRWLGGKVAFVVVAERSLKSSREVFLPATHCSRPLRKAWAMLCSQLELLLETPAVRIHLKCEREELLRRVGVRNRPEESGQERYLSELADRMDRWCRLNCDHCVDTTGLNERQVLEAVKRIIWLELAKRLLLPLLLAAWLMLMLLYI